MERNISGEVYNCGSIVGGVAHATQVEVVDGGMEGVPQLVDWTAVPH